MFKLSKISLTHILCFYCRLYILDAGWSEILVFTYDGEYLTDYDTDDAKDFAIYNVSAVSVCVCL